MKTKDFQFSYPEHLVATEPHRPSRVLYSDKSGQLKELSLLECLDLFNPGDCLVLNNSKVEPRRVYGMDQKGKRHEVLFVEFLGDKTWSVLCPVSRVSGGLLTLPGDIQLEILERGRPQKILLSQDIGLDYFNEYGEMPLPPYIRKARGERAHVGEDLSWYQSAWAKNSGSSAAPTASLHFSLEDIDYLRRRGVHIVEVTLHVGLGTYLPIDVEALDDFKIHFEHASISVEDWELLLNQKKLGFSISALGTTAVRVLESQALGKLKRAGDFYEGDTNLFIKPGFKYKIVDKLMTNFHQPETTLMALVSAFTSVEHVLASYRWAIDHEFRLFSYGDLSVWENPE